MAFLEKFFGLVEFRDLIVIINAHGLDAQFLELRHVRGVGFLLFLALLVLPFAVIHEAANGRLFVWGNFDEVEAGLARHAQRIERHDDPDLFVRFVNKTDGGNSNLFVATQTVLANGESSLSVSIPGGRRSAGWLWRDHLVLFLHYCGREVKLQGRAALRARQGNRVLQQSRERQAAVAFEKAPCSAKTAP